MEHKSWEQNSTVNFEFTIGAKYRLELQGYGHQRWINTEDLEDVVVRRYNNRLPNASIGDVWVAKESE